MTPDNALLIYAVFATWMAVAAHMAIDNTIAALRWARRR